jgi:hypothetical protein
VNFMTRWLQREEPTEDSLHNDLDILRENPRMQDLLRHVAAERLRTLEAMSGVEDVATLVPRLQGRAEGLGYLLHLFDDDEG